VAVLTSRTQSPDFRPQSAAGVPAATSHTCRLGDMALGGAGYNTAT